MPTTGSVLFVSNGHGEDAIACSLIDRLRASDSCLAVTGWPMVGAGAGYRSRSVPVIDAPNLLPSEGFATLSARLLWRDLGAGWIRTHWRQVGAARALRGRFDLIVAVGDVVPVVAAMLARTRFVFVGCAKSEYYGPGWGYSPLELRWLRRHCTLAFLRDGLTAARLERAGVRQRFVGNPMMDDLDGAGDTFGIPDDRLVIVCLPGSRADAPSNAREMLAALPAARTIAPGRAATYLFAVASAFEPMEESALDADTSVRFVHGHSAFADALRRADLVVGAAGTANEQAIGLGRPLVVFPTQGPQGEAYLRMKMRFFGPAAVVAPRERAGLAECLRAILGDPERRERMRRAGFERMGAPGASDAISRIVLAMLERPVMPEGASVPAMARSEV